MDPLVEIPRNKWPELRDLYRNKWPDDAVAFCFLDTQITYPKLAEYCNIKVYSPEGDIHNGFVAVYFNEMGETYEVMIQLLDNIDIIEKALAGSKVIDWTKAFYVSSASPVVVECFRNLEKKLNVIGNTRGNKAYRHFIDRTSKQFDISNSPQNTYVADLKPEHLHIIDKTWTFHNDSSYKMFESLLKNHLTYVLYSTNDDPLAWITVAWEGTLTHLYCIEGHRKKGYAEYILKYAVNDQLNRGKDILAHTLEKNAQAQKLFDKLNFRKIGYDTWIYVIKN
ncbi:uncharacterized protein LOC112052115 isoform X3 [Bicyclus anynana]|uniref:Glycine N-acyltransferase-like protein n=1 Tax=Bicyclus anynana TaxID=110368 RepID=A0ABM3LX89_BICAN|nr:uncharacterized protein LOC112052115 isoform X3 [Bicyclus anynana]